MEKTSTKRKVFRARLMDKFKKKIKYRDQGLENPGNSEDSDMARGDTASRIIRVIYLLEKNPAGFTLAQLHSQLVQDGYECSRRTVYRDLEVIESAYFPIVNEDEGERKVWKLQGIAKLTDKIQFSYHELMALFLAKESLNTLRGSALFENINSFINRLEQALGPGSEKELKNLASYITYKSSATWQTGVSEEVLNTIYECCYEGYELELEYRSKSGDFKDQIKLRRLGPEGLYFADAGVYLVAKDLESGQFKTYSLHRVVQARRTERTYDQDKKFSMGSYIKDNIGVLGTGEVSDIELLIEDPVASYISERRWHDTQQITRESNGVRLKMKVRVNDELVRWIMGLGAAAVVVSPDGLRKSVCEMAQKVMERNSVKKAA
jgi:predicted DNA-binding transcriptional regulator YafY